MHVKNRNCPRKGGTVSKKEGRRTRGWEDDGGLGHIVSFRSSDYS